MDIGLLQTEIKSRSPEAGLDFIALELLPHINITDCESQLILDAINTIQVYRSVSHGIEKYNWKIDGHKIKPYLINCLIICEIPNRCEFDRRYLAISDGEDKNFYIKYSLQYNGKKITTIPFTIQNMDNVIKLFNFWEK